jgi:hypothetical protein
VSTIRHTSTLAAAAALLAAVALSAAACDDLLGGESITGSGELVTETYDLADFTEVDVGHAFEAEIVRADEFSVAITVDDNILENVDVRRDGDTLRIGMKGNDSYRNVTMEAAIAMPALDRLKLSGASKADTGPFMSTEPLKLELSGASEATCADMTSDSAELDLRGASKLECTGFETGEVTVRLQGASKLSLAGAGGNADVKAEGASNADLRDFEVVDAKVKLEGASKATVHPSGTLDVDLAGSSDLVYLGQPSLGQTKMAGDSTLERGD